MSLGDIVLRKDECFWIFPKTSLNNIVNFYSPWFSYLGAKWRLDIRNPDYCFLRVKSRRNLAKCEYTVYLSFKTNCTSCNGLVATESKDVVSDYGCQLMLRRRCLCNSKGFSYIYSQNELVKISFDIRKKEIINNAPDKKNDGQSSVKDEEENSENEEISQDEDDSENEYHETSEDEVITEVMSSADKNINKRESVASGAEGIERLAENFKQVFLDGRLSDVVLQVDSREFNVHKLVLVARSPVFASMFEHDLAEKNTNVVDIPDCVAESFEVFLFYLYSGSTETMSVGNVYNVYYAADKYRVDDLKQQCVKFMKMNLSVETFCDTISLSLRHEEPELKKKSISFFCKNIKKIIKTVQWQKYLAENPTHANELLIKALKA